MQMQSQESFSAISMASQDNFSPSFQAPQDGEDYDQEELMLM